MPEDVRTIRTVDWRSVFPFLHLFRSFRIATHPSKLLLAAAFLLLVYGVGLAMDAAWPQAYSHRAVGTGPLLDLPERMGSEAGLLPGDPGSAASGPFEVLLRYELSQLQALTEYVFRWDLGGVIQSVFNFVVVGPGWGFRVHPLFSTLFGGVILLAWSLFGGAIARVTAVHVARDEKISMRSALRFSSGKLLSFVFAPVILALFIGALGLFIAVTNLLFYIPQAGPAAVGIIFILTMVAGFVMTLALFGGVGGFSLMYPTIAVEGSDSFDSISRSFSYFFARPWKLLGYALTALIYGVVTFVFIKLFLIVMFDLIQLFQQWMLNGEHRKSYLQFFPGPGNGKADPFAPLAYDPDYAAVRKDLGVGGEVGSRMVGFWYTVVVGLVGAYAISFYFTASTITYYLLRQDVDATELDDVYLEESDEDDLAELTAPAGGPDAPPAPGTPAPGPEGDLVDDAKADQPGTFSASPPTQ